MQYDFNMSAGGGQRIDAQGKSISYKNGVGAVRVTTSKGEIVDLLPGQGVKALEFNWLTIKDISGATNTGALVIGNYEFFDNNLYGTMTVTGKVQAIDGNRELSMAGGTFMAGRQVLAITGGAQNLIALKNPAGSGKNLIVERLFGAGAGIGLIYHYLMLGALPTSSGNSVGPLNLAVNIKADGPGSAARIYVDGFLTTASNLSATAGWANAKNLLVTPHMANGGGASYSATRETFPKPIVLPPDSAYIVIPENQAGIQFTFEYREEPV